MTLLEALKIARHDLGKYVCMQARWAEDDLRDALMADLVHTHRSASGSRSAVAVWDEVRERLVAAGASAERVAGLDDAVATIRRFVDDPSGTSDADLHMTRDAALAVSDTLKEWYAEVRALG